MTDIKDTVEAPEIDPASLTQEEKDEIGRKAQKLIETDPDLQTAFVVMLASFQMYNVALGAMGRRCRQLKLEEAVQYVLRESVKEAGKAEFSRQGVIDKLQKYGLPFLMQEVQLEQEREKELTTAEDEAEDNRRRQLPVTIGYPTIKDGPITQERERAVVLAGHAGALRVLMDKTTQMAITAKGAGGFRASVLELRSEAFRHVNMVFASAEARRQSQADKQYARVGINRWLYCARSNKVMDKTLQPWLQQLRKKRVDLLLINDLSQMVEKLNAKQESQVVAGMALRALRKWCEEVGCACLAGLPVGDEMVWTPELDDQVCVPPPIDNTWSQLEVYSDLRFVTVSKVAAEEGWDYQLSLSIPGDKTPPHVVVEHVARDLIENWKANACTTDV